MNKQILETELDLWPLNNIGVKVEQTIPVVKEVWQSCGFGESDKVASASCPKEPSDCKVKYKSILNIVYTWYFYYYNYYYH